MSKLESILAVVPAERKMSPAVHRAIAYARRTQAKLHLCLFDRYGPIDYAGRVFGAEVAGHARRDFLEERSRWLAEQARGLAQQGLRVEFEAVWAPRRFEAIIGKVLETQSDLVVKDVASDPAAGTLLPASQVKRRIDLDAAASIADTAREVGADLVVLGSAYHSGFEKLMFGTTAEALLRRASCDALMVKPAGFLDELAKHFDLDKLRARGAAPVAA